MVDRLFDYEFVFNDTFEQDVFDIYPIVDTDNTLQGIVSDIATKLTLIIRAQPGIRCVCSYGYHDDQTLKITVNNTNWRNPN